MSDSKAVRMTQKGEQTRGLILDAALKLFAERGYQGTTMREIAAHAGTSTGLAYRYFARKEELVLAFYVQCAANLEEEVKALPPGSLVERFEIALRADIRRVAPYRSTFGALFGVALSPESEVAVLGESMGVVRQRVWNTFLLVTSEAVDAPRGKQSRDIATIFYAIHLALVLFWLQDRSEGQKATDALIVLLRDVLKRMRPALRIPLVARHLSKLAEIIGPMFGPMPPQSKSRPL